MYFLWIKISGKGGKVMEVYCYNHGIEHHPRMNRISSHGMDDTQKDKFQCPECQSIVLVMRSV